MARWDRRTRLLAELQLRDDTKRGLASASRGFSGYMSGISREAGMVSQSISGALTGNAAFAGAAMGAAMLGFAGHAASAFSEVELKWAEVTTLMPNQTKQATDKMFGHIKEFSRRTGFEIRDSLTATYQAISAGIDPSNTESFLTIAGKAARGGITDLTTSVDALTTVLNAYDQEADKATDRSDELFTAIRLGKTTFQELAPVMGPVLPIAASLNTEFQEITASVAALTAQGNPTAIAMTQIRSALVALTKDTEARGIFERLFGMTYKEYQEQGGTLQDALTAIVRDVEAAGGSITQAFGRVEAANAALALSSEKGAEVFKEAMGDVSGATEEAAGKIEETTSTSMEKVGAWWDDIKLGVGGIVADLAVGVLQLVGLVERTASDTTSSISEMIAAVREELTTLPAVPVVADTPSGANVYYSRGVTSGPQFRRRTENIPISQLELETAYTQWLDDEAKMGNVDVMRPITDPSLRSELERRVWANRNLAELGAFDRSYMNRGVITTPARQRSIDAQRQRTRGSPFDRSLQEAAFGGGGGTPSTVVGGVGGAGNPAQMASTAAYSAVAAIVDTMTGGGGGGGGLADAIRQNTLSNRELAELMRSGQALTVQLDANVDEGVVLRADTVRRDIGQVSARMGNMLVNRKRSG